MIFQTRSYRILACTHKGNRVILLHGFQKKTRETPRQELEIAEQRKKRYLQTHGYL
jgi:phage-related protein